MNELNVTPPRPIDSSSMSEWTEQEIFDYTISLWAERGFTLAINDSGSCLYRSAVGPCLIGMMLPDSCYRESFEGNPFSRIYEELDPHMLSQRIDFLCRLQRLHDNSPRLGWIRQKCLKDRIRSFAADNGLTLPAGVEERLEALGEGGGQ